MWRDVRLRALTCPSRGTRRSDAWPCSTAAHPASPTSRSFGSTTPSQSNEASIGPDPVLRRAGRHASFPVEAHLIGNRRSSLRAARGHPSGGLRRSDEKCLPIDRGATLGTGLRFTRRLAKVVLRATAFRTAIVRWPIADQWTGVAHPDLRDLAAGALRPRSTVRTSNRTLKLTRSPLR